MNSVNEIRFYRATGINGYLSNLYPATIVFLDHYTMQDRVFSCAETAYQFGKPNNQATANWIINAPTPSECAMAAHALPVFKVCSDWNSLKVARMEHALLAKFTQHPELAEKLLATGKANLIEESNTDAFWGIGKKGNGRNMLGELLMSQRSRLAEKKGAH